MPADPNTFPSVFDGAPAERDGGFAELGLPHQLVRALTQQGITTPFEIQAATVPDALAGRDVLGRGQTGSGKTLAFGLPMLTRLANTGRGKTTSNGRARPGHPRALILVPTRELAMQVADALTPLGRTVGVFLKTAVGGVPYDRQIEALRRGVEVLVATPGRLGDLIRRGACSLDDIEITVLDEADQMADLGFLPEVTELLDKTPAGSQRLLFSATLDGDVDALVRRFMNDPVTHATEPAIASVSTMDHHLLTVPPHDKFGVAASIAARRGRTIMFVRTQAGVDRMAAQLAEVGVRAGALHGGKHQRVRTRTLAEFREGKVNVLVATDVAARGIHVDGVSLVVHLDPPRDAKDYLHRAGRTARAGESGGVVTLVLPKQRKSTLAMLERAGVKPGEARVRSGDAELAELTGAQAPSGVPVRDEPPAPRQGRRDGQGRGREGGGRPSGGREFRGSDSRGSGSSGSGFRGQDDRGRTFRHRDDSGSGFRSRDDRGAGFPNRDTGFRGRDDRGTGNSARDDRGAGFRGRDDRGAGFPNRDTGFRGRDDRGAGFQDRDSRGAGYSARDDRGREVRGGSDRGREFRTGDDRGGDFRGRDDRGRRDRVGADRARSHGHPGEGHRGHGHPGDGHRADSGRTRPTAVRHATQPQ
jgi:superfamily II DNA/RNA helicase